MLAPILKVAAILWVGLVFLVGLIINGEKLYSWIGGKSQGEQAEMRRLLDLMFVEVSEKRLRIIYSGFLVLMFFLGASFMWPHVLSCVTIGTLFVVVSWRMPRILISILHKQRIKRFVVQMVDALSLMSNAMRSGLNVPQAMSIVTAELPNPISQEFALVLSQNKLGITLEEAMSNLSVRMPNDDIEMYTTSVNILKETGGNLAETFDIISQTIRDRIKVESKIQAMTAQGVLQGIIVVLMPFVLGGILYVIDPARIQPMFTTIPGWAMLTIMMALQVVGGFTIWKIVQIRV